MSYYSLSGNGLGVADIKCMSYISVDARAALDFGKHVVLFKYYRSNKKGDI